MDFCVGSNDGIMLLLYCRQLFGGHLGFLQESAIILGQLLPLFYLSSNHAEASTEHNPINNVDHYEGCHDHRTQPCQFSRYHSPRYFSRHGLYLLSTRWRILDQRELIVRYTRVGATLGAL